MGGVDDSIKHVLAASSDAKKIRVRLSFYHTPLFDWKKYALFISVKKYSSIDQIFRSPPTKDQMVHHYT